MHHNLGDSLLLPEVEQLTKRDNRLKTTSEGLKVISAEPIILECFLSKINACISLTGEPISTSTNRPATTAAPPRVSASESQGPSTDMYPGTGNLIHSLGHPKEDHHCPEGWLIDVYGYCR